MSTQVNTMKVTRPLLRYYFPLLSYCFWWALASAQNSGTPQNVLEAINICREKLKVDPHFPRIQHSLAQLLDSQISPSDVDPALVAEVFQLYQAVGQPSSHVTGKRLPPAKVRFESLTRAGNIANDMLHDKPQAIKCYSLAMSLDVIEESSLLLAFKTIMPILLSLVKVEHQIEVTISPDNGLMTSDASSEVQHTQIAFDLCNILEIKSPTETIVDEYRGALLRRMKQPELAYQSYHQAMVKSKQNILSAEGESDQDSNEHVTLIADFVRTSILTSAAAREAGYDFQQQMNYLVDAEKLAAPQFASMNKNQDMDEHLKESFRDQIVDLYNNMGITEKKQGSLERARVLFSKAFEINPKDGHALVQLASVDGDKNDDVVSSAKELDPEYVGALFDGYSSRFESELVDVLGYTGHSLLYAALQKALKKLGKSPLSVKKIIDLGCGTGLLGEIVANEMPWVELSGADLSQRMVEISRERKSSKGRNVYASVSNEEAVKYLSNLETQSVDCIIASDVVNYIGDISNMLEESSKCLIKNGLVGFTAESYEGSNTDNGLRLLPNGRFGHSRSYINSVAKLNGFEVLVWEDCVLRQQKNVDVRGASIVLKKI